ncbi:hypothetical protein K431DRAFT_298150 [Polychaeton citri CBS 116435]|uniref:Uncharacterized protein n=1 Tax=Polychaeton citri CBS 116435 TaxID=1314669 RepID=A0A9P4PY01_9PEZI|nr:hypothetical protein K431DRAFT_298150 [Polychaeton citri CBS 116435]
MKQEHKTIFAFVLHTMVIRKDCKALHRVANKATVRAAAAAARTYSKYTTGLETFETRKLQTDIRYQAGMQVSDSTSLRLLEFHTEAARVTRKTQKAFERENDMQSLKVLEFQTNVARVKKVQQNDLDPVTERAELEIPKPSSSLAELKTATLKSLRHYSGSPRSFPFKQCIAGQEVHVGDTKGQGAVESCDDGMVTGAAEPLRGTTLPEQDPYAAATFIGRNEAELGNQLDDKGICTAPGDTVTRVCRNPQMSLSYLRKLFNFLRSSKITPQTEVTMNQDISHSEAAEASVANGDLRDTRRAGDTESNGIGEIHIHREDLEETSGIIEEQWKLGDSRASTTHEGTYGNGAAKLP